MYRSVIEAGVEKLYHYEKFHDDWLSTTLSQRKIHCSNPATLNDPWDCRPCYDVSCLPFERLLEFSIQVAEPPLTPSQIHDFEYRLQTIPNFKQDFIDGLSGYICKLIHGFRIYCLTSDATSTLMWSHYANNHRGICLEFKTNNTLLSEAKEVIYRSEYPRWNPCDLEEIAFKMLLTKSDVWQYEREFRIISGSNMEKDQLSVVEGNWLRLPLGALEAVIVGAEGDYSAVCNVVNDHAPDLRVRLAVRVPNHYRLQLVP